MRNAVCGRVIVFELLVLQMCRLKLFDFYLDAVLSVHTALNFFHHRQCVTFINCSLIVELKIDFNKIAAIPVEKYGFISSSFQLRLNRINSP